MFGCVNNGFANITQYIPKLGDGINSQQYNDEKANKFDREGATEKYSLDTQPKPPFGAEFLLTQIHKFCHSICRTGNEEQKYRVQQYVLVQRNHSYVYEKMVL